MWEPIVTLKTLNPCCVWTFMAAGLWLRHCYSCTGSKHMTGATDTHFILNGLHFCFIYPKSTNRKQLQLWLHFQSILGFLSCSHVLFTQLEWIVLFGSFSPSAELCTLAGPESSAADQRDGGCAAVTMMSTRGHEDLVGWLRLDGLIAECPLVLEIIPLRWVVPVTVRIL